LIKTKEELERKS